MPTSVMFVGHSHIHALKNACRKSPFFFECEPRQQLVAEFFPLVPPEFPANALLGSGALGRQAIEAISQSSAEFVVSCIGGNEHSILGLLNHPQRFDFVLAEEPDLPLDETAAVLPGGAVRSSLLRLMEDKLTFFKALRLQLSKRMLHLQSPPPIPSADHIRKYPGAFKDKIDKLGVAPAVLRYKLWRLQSSIMSRACEEADVLFVPVPRETQDADGMMIERAWNPDPTHGNAWYGGCVLRQLTSRNLRLA